MENLSLMFSLEEGKYTLYRYTDGRMEVERYRKPWRELTGDKFVNALVDELERLAKRVKELEHGNSSDQ